MRNSQDKPSIAEGFFISAIMGAPQRVKCYVDGFNFYYGLKAKNWRCYYWLDMVSFIQQFMRPHQELVEVNYFSAVPSNIDKSDRQDLFFSANKLNPKFNLYLGKYLKKRITCKHCSGEINTYEEKQTDVHIATKLIRDVVLDNCDVSILITADSDLTPPIDLIREIKPNHKILVYFPPKRFSFDLKQKADNITYLENHPLRFQNAMMPNEVVLPNNYICKRPKKWH